MKRITHLTVLLSALVILLPGCAAYKGSIVTDVRGIADTAQRGKLYKNYVVSAPIDDLIFRTHIEEALSKRFLEEYNIIAIPFTRLFPPTRLYSETEVKQTLHDYRIPASLVIMIGVNQEKDIGISTKGSSVGSAYGLGYPSQFPVAGSTSAVGIVSTSENSSSKRFVGRDIKASITVYDLSTGNKVWIGGLTTIAEEGSNTNDREYTSDKPVAKSISKYIAKALEKDGLIRDTRK
jgi:hypothetical protein